MKKIALKKMVSAPVCRDQARYAIERGLCADEGKPFNLDV